MDMKEFDKYKNKTKMETKPNVYKKVYGVCSSLTKKIRMRKLLLHPMMLGETEVI